MEVKREADSIDVTACSQDDKPSNCMFFFLLSCYFYWFFCVSPFFLIFLTCYVCMSKMNVVIFFVSYIAFM